MLRLIQGTEGLKLLIDYIVLTQIEVIMKKR